MQERGRGGQAAARLRPAGRALELRGDLLVRSRRGGGQMPRATVGVDAPGRSPPPAPDGPPGVASASLIGRRRSAPADGGRSRALRSRATRPSPRPSAATARSRVARPRARAAADRRPAQPPRAAADVARRRTSALDPTNEALLDPSWEALRLEQAEAARQLRRRQAARQLEQRQRIPARLGDDPVADSLIQLEPHRRAQQRAGVAVAHAAHLQLGHVLKLLARLARGEHDPDRLRQQATGDKRQRQRRSLIQPLRVIDDTQQRTLLGQPPRTGSTPPTRRGTDPELRRRSARTRSPSPDAAEPEASSSRSSSGPHS